MVVTAIRNLLASNADILSQLAQFDFGDGSNRPAIFTESVVPRTCGNPAIVIEQDDGGEFETRGRRGAIVRARLTVWGDKNATGKPLRSLAFDVWRLLDRSTYMATGYKAWPIVATVPAFITDGDGFPGYRITATTRILEE